MGIVFTNNKYYKEIALKIRRVLGIDTKYKSSEMSQAIRSMTSSAVEDYSTIVNGAMFNSDSVTVVGSKIAGGAFAGCTAKTVEFPDTVTSLPDCAFYESSVENIVLSDNVTSIGDYCFYNCNELKSVNIPKNLRSVGAYAFRYCRSIKQNIILPSTLSSNSIGTYGFAQAYFSGIEVQASSFSIRDRMFFACYELKTLVLRCTSVCGLSDNNQLNSSLIDDGEGYIYVPSSLINSYKSNTYWSQYANQFRALEDYTIDGTVTGEFDYSRV